MTDDELRGEAEKIFLMRGMFLDTKIGQEMLISKMVQLLRPIYAKGREQGIEEAADKVCGMDHCDLNGHGCTTEIRDAIRALKSQQAEHGEVGE